MNANQNETKKVKQPHHWRIGALDIILIVALLLVITFPILRHYVGDTRGINSGADYIIEVYVYDINPIITDKTKVYYPDNNLVGSVSKVEYYPYIDESDREDEARKNAQITFTATDVTTTSGGLVMLAGKTYVEAGKEIMLMFSDTASKTGAIEVYVRIVKVFPANSVMPV